MAKIRSWEVSEEFWKRVEPLIPERERDQARTFRRRPGGGRKSIDPRRVFEGIVYVLRTGCHWKFMLKQQYGSASFVHQYFRDWLKSGFFLALWRTGLAEYDEMGALPANGKA